MTETSKEDDVALQRVPCIYYLIQFKKKEVPALIDPDNKVNTMIPTYVSRLCFRVHRTDIRAQKIDGSTFKTFGIVLASFQVEDKLEKIWYFRKTFLLADISTKVVLGISFLTLSNADVQFVEKKLT